MLSINKTSWIRFLGDGPARCKVSFCMFQHMHLQIRLVCSLIRAIYALMHRLFAAFIDHVSFQILHVVITTIAVVTDETTLTATSTLILHCLRHARIHLGIICNYEKRFVNNGRDVRVTYFSSQFSVNNNSFIDFLNLCIFFLAIGKNSFVMISDSLNK